MKIGICKLCHQERELLKMSHIIPNSLYKVSMDKENYLINTTNLELRSGIKKPKKIYTGEFDTGILCAECDNNRLGKLDEYGLKVFHRGFASKEFSHTIKNVYNPRGFNFSIIQNVNYTKFKLFLLSIVWRSSVSSRPFFKDVSLEHNEEVLRKMLLEQDPGSNKDFPVLIYMPHAKDLNLKSLIGQPSKIIFLNMPCFVFVINGLIFFFIITKEILDRNILEFTINTNNEFRIAHLPEGKSREYILRFIKIQ